MVENKALFYTLTFVVGIVLAIAANLALDAGCELSGAITSAGKVCVI